MLKTQNVKSSRKQCLLSVLLQLYATTCENLLKDFANTVKRLTVSLVPTVTVSTSSPERLVTKTR